MNAQPLVVALFITVSVLVPRLLIYRFLKKQYGPPDKGVIIRARLGVLEVLLIGLAIYLVLDNNGSTYSQLYLVPLVLCALIWIWRVIWMWRDRSRGEN